MVKFASSSGYAPKWFDDPMHHRHFFCLSAENQFINVRVDSPKQDIITVVP